MPIPVPPYIRVKLYQLEENGGGTDFIKKVSPAELTYETGGSANGFHVVNMSDLSQSIEIDKGVYQIDGVSATISGLSSAFFNLYADALNEPYVCEIYDTANSKVLFHGPIDRKSVDYDAKTGYTTFEVNSWLYVFEQTSAAARSVYETVMSKKYRSGWEEDDRVVFIQKVIDGVDMSTVVDIGDVVVFDDGAAEYRGPVFNTTVSGDNLLLSIAGPQVSLYVTGIVIPAIDTIKFRGFVGDSLTNFIGFEVTNVPLYEALQRFHNDPTSPEYQGNEVNLFVTVNGGGTSGQTDVIPISNSEKLNNGEGLSRHFNNAFRWGLDVDGETVNIFFAINDPFLSDMDEFGITIDVGTRKEINAGSKIRILGREVYGYVETAGNAEVTSQMRVQKIIEGAFGLTDLGVMQYVTDTFTYPGGWDPTWDKHLEYPVRLIDSLRQIQDSEYIFVKFTPTLDGGGLPRMTLEVIPRTAANTSDRTSTAITGIIDYKEKSANVIPRAVVVEPANLYKLPKVFNHFKHKGFYYDGIPTDVEIIASTPAPEGADVLKVKANWTPTYTGKRWASNGKTIMNDPIGMNKARRFYEFYKNLNRVANFKYDGTLDPITIGNFITIAEGGLTRTIFVTELSTGIVSEETSVTGFVGEYVESTSSTPVSIIIGDLRFTDIDSSGSEPINMSGAASYDPDGGALTFEWILDPTGAPTTISTTSALEAYALVVGTHTIRLTVNNGTATASTDVQVKVITPSGSSSTPTTLQANFQTSPFLTIAANGDVFVNISTDTNTQVAAGITVEYSTVAAIGPWTAAAASPFTGPVNLGVVLATLAEDTTLYVRVRLLNFSDAAVSTNEWISQITNSLGSTMDSLNIATLLNLDGSFDMDGAAADTFSVVINGNTIVEANDAGLHELYGGGNLIITLDGTGMQVDIPTGDLFEILYNSVTALTVGASGIQIEMDLDMQSNDIIDVNDITAAGTIAGIINATGGATFGPSAVTSITVANGIITAIS